MTTANSRTGRWLSGAAGALLAGPVLLAPTAHAEALRVAQAAEEARQAQTPQVGEAPPEQEPERPQVQTISEVGGVLTPDGVLIIEPELQFSNSQVNRFNFLGVQILDTFLIGLVEAQDVDQDVYVAALNFRHGVTDRFEVGLKVPYVYRQETRAATIVQTDTVVESELEGAGLGDVEISLHYQLNSGRGGWPFVIANLRYKTTTGEGPFEIDYTAQGLEDEAATGSGFKAVEPSLTFLMPSDPAVFYANIGYLFNLSDDVDRTLGEGESAIRIGEVDPGDAVRLGFGMALAINPRASFSFGYQHDFIQETEIEVSTPGNQPITDNTASLDVGKLVFGLSHALGRRTSVSVSVEVGVTADAPDVLVSASLPIAFGP